MDGLFFLMGEQQLPLDVEVHDGLVGPEDSSECDNPRNFLKKAGTPSVNRPVAFQWIFSTMLSYHITISNVKMCERVVHLQSMCQVNGSFELELISCHL